MTDRLKYSLLAVVFLLGYTSLAFELIVLRQLINFVGSNTLITSVVMAFILLFLSVGYYFGSVVKFARRPVRTIMLNFAKILIVWYIIAGSYYLMEIYFYMLYLLGLHSSLGFVFVYAAAFWLFLRFASGLSPRLPDGCCTATTRIIRGGLWLWIPSAACWGRLQRRLFLCRLSAWRQP